MPVGCLTLTPPILGRERGLSKRDTLVGKCSYVEAELKYQGARFARKWNVRRFSGLHRKNGRRAAEEKMCRREGSRFA